MRPGGLTALSIFNFIFGGLSGLINLIGLATMSMQIAEMEKQSRVTGIPVPSEALLYGMMSFAMVRAALLITSGVGYLGRKKFIGYWLGNLYAVLALIAITIEIATLKGQFTILSLVDFVYPLITLFLLNVIFRKDFQ
jgi:hypothetical protein